MSKSTLLIQALINKTSKTFNLPGQKHLSLSFGGLR